jgi:hypothetical protein
VIQVPVTQHDGLDRPDVDAESFGIDGQTVGGDAGVEQQGVGGPAAPNGHQGGEPVLRDEPRVG